MNEETIPLTSNYEEGEEMLELLIRQSGEKARERKAQALANHQKKLEAAIKEVLARQVNCNGK